MTNLDSSTQLYKALAHRARLRILAMLRGGDLCACQITAALGLAPSTISAHVAELRRAGLVTERKDGRWVHFDLAKDPGARATLRQVWRQIESDPQVAEDAAALARLREIPVEQLCRMDQPLAQLERASVSRPSRAART
ncbi:MAG: metalloregulator ArsR/SmtB family transcription factor [Gemmatimonadales bacterium]|nr:metalloregulator ArsR/SmtB family transcription factor [Gemmatimonadales bacterium]